MTSTSSDLPTNDARSTSSGGGYVVSEQRQEPGYLEAARSAGDAHLNRQSPDSEQQAFTRPAPLQNLLLFLPAAARNRVASVFHWFYPPTTSTNPIQSSQETSLRSALSHIMDVLRHQRGHIQNMPVNPALMRSVQDLLREENYTDIPSQVGNENDLEKLIGFLIYLFDRNMLPSTNLDLKRRARRLILELAATMQKIPDVLYLTPSELKLGVQFAITYGHFADIYLGSHRGVKVAVKRIRNVTLDKEFCREALVWRTIAHKHVLPFIGIYLDQSKSFTGLASLFMENGSLSDWRKKGGRNVSEIEHHIYNVAEGLGYLHHEGIVHGDLCGANVLLDHNHRVHIADFSIMRHSEDTMTRFSALSFQYTASELFPGEEEEEDSPNRTMATDVYAFACLYYEIFFGTLPFAGKNLYYISTKVKKGIRPQRLYDPPLTDRGWEVIQRCWDQDPARRPTMDEVGQTMRTIVPG